jgi:small multidrug resistance pump
MNYVFLAVAILAEVIATTALKASDNFSKLLPSILTVIGYLIAFACLSQTLRTIPTGVAYAIWSGVGIVLVSLAAWLLQGQKLDTPAVLGIGLIVAGVVVMNLFSKTAGR